MASSHFERLLWDFIKNYFLAGFFLFFTINLLPLTIYTILSVVLIYHGYIRANIIFLQGLSLIAIGLLLRNKTLKLKFSFLLVFFLSLTLAVYEMGIFYTPFGVAESVLSSFSTYILILLLIAWLIFNSAYIIIEIAEFFSSTTGLLVLWGSDEKHIFFSPIPQLLVISALIASTYYYLANKIYLLQLLLITSALFTQLLLIYVIYRNKGRIVRSSFSLFSAFTAYLTLALLLNQNYSQATMLNITITMITILFMMQSRMKKLTSLTSEDKKGSLAPPIAVLLVYGTIFVLYPILNNMSRVGTDALSIIWQLNIFAALIASILITFYWKKTSKVEWYYKRDKISTKDLLIETTLVIGSKFFEELLKLAKIDLEQTLKTTTEKASKIAKKIDDTVKKVKENLWKYFKK